MSLPALDKGSWGELELVYRLGGGDALLELLGVSSIPAEHQNNLQALCDVAFVAMPEEYKVAATARAGVVATSDARDSVRMYFILQGACSMQLILYPKKRGYLRDIFLEIRHETSLTWPKAAYHTIKRVGSGDRAAFAGTPALREEWPL